MNLRHFFLPLKLNFEKILISIFDMIKLPFVLVLAYLLTFAAYFADIKKESLVLAKIKRLLLFATLLFHATAFFYSFEIPKNFPIATKSELFSVIAFSVALIYFILELLTEIHGTGFTIIFFALLFQLLSVLLFDEHTKTTLPKIEPFIGFHIFAVLISYVSFSISIAYGAMYVALVSKLKKNRFDLFFNRLPNLEILIKLSSVSYYVGLTVLTIAILIGGLWLPKIFPGRDFYDPKVFLTGFAWLVFAVGAWLNLSKRITGKKFIYFELFAFGVLLLVSILTTFFIKTFHSF